jgi:hypothetical protein
MGGPHFRVKFSFWIDKHVIRHIISYFVHIPLFILNMGGISKALCGQNLELLNVKIRGIFSDWVETPHLRRTENPITVGKNYLH